MRTTDLVKHYKTNPQAEFAIAAEHLYEHERSTMRVPRAKVGIGTLVSVERYRNYNLHMWKSNNVAGFDYAKAIQGERAIAFLFEVKDPDGNLFYQLVSPKYLVGLVSDLAAYWEEEAKYKAEKAIKDKVKNELEQGVMASIQATNEAKRKAAADLLAKHGVKPKALDYRFSVQIELKDEHLDPNTLDNYEITTNFSGEFRLDQDGAETLIEAFYEQEQEIAALRKELAQVSRL